MVILDKKLITPKKRVAPAFVPWFCASMYVAIAASVIVSILMKNPIVLLVGAGLGAILFIISRSFSWYKSAELRKTNKFLVYEVENILSMLGHTKTKYEIHSCTDVKLRGSTAIVFGNIREFEPLSKGRDISRVVINDANDEIKDYIMGYFQK